MKIPKTHLINLIAILGIGIICCVFLLNTSVGSTKQKVLDELEERGSAVNWTYIADAGDSMIAGLSYNVETHGYDADIYVNRPGLSFGWFFRTGGALLDTGTVTEIHIENIRDYALLSMNEQGVCRIDIDDGTSVKTISIDPDAPFVMILSESDPQPTLYDKSGEIVTTSRRGG